MMRSTTRVAVAGCMALAALSSAVVLDAGSATAEAAPSASPFAGTYVGRDPSGWVSQWNVTIEDGGRITGVRPGFSRDKIGGRVDADGSYAFSVTATIWVIAHRRGVSDSEPESELRTVSYKSTGTLAPDASGNIVGTDDTGGSFLWVRQ